MVPYGGQQRRQIFVVVGIELTWYARIAVSIRIEIRFIILTYLSVGVVFVMAS